MSEPDPGAVRYERVGAAALVKGYPLLLSPAFVRRGGVRFVVSLAATFLLYIPYAGVGWRVFGFLPTYVHEEGIDSGDRFVLLRLLRLAIPLPTWLYVALVALAFAVVSLGALRRAAPDARLEAREVRGRDVERVAFRECANELRALGRRAGGQQRHLHVDAARAFQVHLDEIRPRGG